MCQSCIMKNDDLLTPEQAKQEYNGALGVTAQAAHDRWPEAKGMRRRLFDLAFKAGIPNYKVAKDLDEVKVLTDGGRW